VFEEKAINLAELKEVLATNFEGAEDVRQMLLNRAPNLATIMTMPMNWPGKAP